MILADTSLTFDPVYPMSLAGPGAARILFGMAPLGTWLAASFVIFPGWRQRFIAWSASIGLLAAEVYLNVPVFFEFALLLLALTVGTYVGVKQVSRGRMLGLLLLRLGALFVLFSMFLRPSVAVTRLEGVEASKLFLVFDASASMNVAEIKGEPTRWQKVDSIWNSTSVQRRVRRLAQEEKVDIVKYLGAAELRPDEKDAVPDGPRTDIAVWLHELYARHGHEKQVRAIAIFSDGADNGARFVATEKARRWRGVAPIHAFGVGDPNNTRFKKDLGLTRLDVRPDRIFVNAPIRIEAVVQAPGFEKVEFHGSVEMEDVANKKKLKPEVIPKFRIDDEKGQKLKLDLRAPGEPGEYRLTVKIVPHDDETNQTNNEISTYFRVSKEKINVLWVDRPRVYEPKLIIDLALAPEEQLRVHHVTVPKGTKGNPLTLYKLDSQHFDAIVIGDLSANQFSLGDPKVFERINEMVTTKKTGLLMLGGAETLANGGWREVEAIRSLLPVDLKLKENQTGFSSAGVQAIPAASLTPKQFDEFSFLKLDADPKKNQLLWNPQGDDANGFEELAGLSILGEKTPRSTVLLTGINKELVMAATKAGTGNVAVFAGASTAERWLGSDESAKGFIHFWKRLVFWLADQDNRSDALVVKLDKRRVFTGADDVLGFTMALRSPKGEVLPGAQFTGKVLHGDTELPVRIIGDRGTFHGAKEPGDYKLIVEGMSRDKSVKGTDDARFVAATDDTETFRPLAEHDKLSRIAAASEGRFHLAEETAFLAFLEELAANVKSEARLRTTNWPDWRRVPPSESVRDQAVGVWNSFALIGMLLFVTFLGTEWLLRRIWGLV